MTLAQRFLPKELKSNSFCLCKLKFHFFPPLHRVEYIVGKGKKCNNPGQPEQSSQASKNVLSKIWTNGVQLWEKKKFLVASNFFFSLNVFKSCLMLMSQTEYFWSKGLRQIKTPFIEHREPVIF